MRAIELEENTERLDVLDYEASKARLAEIRKLEEESRVSSRPETKPCGGRPVEAGSTRSLAAASGASKDTVNRLEHHVDLAEQYPVFKRPEITLDTL